MDNPFAITIYDKTFTRLDWLDDPVRISVTPRHLAIGESTIVVTSNHAKLSSLLTKGARVTIHHKDEQILSGPIRWWQGSGPRTAGLFTFTVEDDKRIFWNMFGYPSPANSIDTQPDKEDARTGPAETVTKGYVSANKGRWASVVPITVPTSLGRGSSITAAIRMKPLAEVLIPLLVPANIGFTVRQVGAGLTFDCYTPQTYPLTLSEDGGTVIDYTMSQNAFTASRAIVGGPNTGTSREFKLVTDSTREAAWGDVIESFADASSEQIASKILAVGSAALADAAATYGFSVTLTETSVFTYGGTDGLHVGDIVTVQANPDTPPITDVITEATLTFDRDNGFTATPSVGDPTDAQTKRLTSILRKLTRGYRDLTTR